MASWAAGPATAPSADAIASHYQVAQAAEGRGDFQAALAAYEWFDAAPQSIMARWRQQGADLFGDSAADATLAGLAYDRLYTLRGDYRGNPDLHQAVLDMIVQAYDVIDRRYWPAHIAAGRFFLAHDQVEDAAREFVRALKINPQASEAMDFLGRIAVRQFAFDKADQAVAQLRKLDRHSADADRLEARNLMRQQKPAAAQKLLAKLLAGHPEDLPALGLLAASQAMQFHPEQVQQTLDRIKTITPNDASACFEVADALSMLRQYDRAESMYKRAVAKAPWWTEPRNGLGLLYTQSGDESAARSALQAAHELDPYNLRTTNYLRLLDDMAKMERLQTPHFTLIYNAKTDPLVPLYFPARLEAIYQKVCGDFQHEPAQKTMIEVFPHHDQFSVRTTGGPWIETIGASTGRVIALTAPRADAGGSGAYDWARVVRHEFTHTVTLSATHNRIPHWFTEGLAVSEEAGPIPWEWAPMLYHAANENKLFPLDQLTWAFVRPKQPSDRQLAYAQSLWIVQYIEQKWGHAAILDLLHQFRDGAEVDAAVGGVLHRTLGQFDAEFLAWAKQRVANWGYDPKATERYKHLCDQGQSLVDSAGYQEALNVWSQAAQVRPMDELPHQRLAGLYLHLKQDDLAVAQLNLLSRATQDNDAYSRRSARLLLDRGRLDQAAQAAARAIEINLYDPKAHEILLQVAVRRGDSQTAARERQALALLKNSSAQ